jgi:hypothetical protein
VPTNREVGVTYRLYEREVNFYTRVRPQIEGLAAPECFGGQYEPATGDSFLLLEDLAAYRVGDQVVGCTAAEAMEILDAVIPLHARYWNRIDDPLLEGMTKVDDPDQMAGIAAGCAAGWDPCVDMFPEAMPDEIRAMKERFTGSVPELHRMVGRLVQTVIHGDLRLDNMMFGDTPDLRPVVLLDWTLTKTSGLHDVAYLVSQNVDLAERRAHEAEIIEHYHRGWPSTVWRATRWSSAGRTTGWSFCTSSRTQSSSPARSTRPTSAVRRSCGNCCIDRRRP